MEILNLEKYYDQTIKPKAETPNTANYYTQTSQNKLANSGYGSYYSQSTTNKMDASSSANFYSQSATSKIETSSAGKSNDQSIYRTPDNVLESEGILNTSEPYETIYLAEDEIEKFIQKYIQDNPGTEIETRFITHPPIEVKQEIEIRYLRPPTPEIPPIIVQEIPVIQSELPPLRIVEKQLKKAEEDRREPIVIREMPNQVTFPDIQTVYVQNIIKKENNKSEYKDSSVEKILKESEKRILNSHTSRLDYGDNVKVEKNSNITKGGRISFEERASVIDYEEEFEHTFEDEEVYKNKSFERLDHSTDYRLYEEKLKDTLYEEYLLRLEKEEIERQLTRSGVFRERLRERSNSNRSQSGTYVPTRTRSSTSRINEEKQYYKSSQSSEDEFRRRLLRDEEERLRKQIRLEEEMRIRAERALMEEEIRSRQEESSVRTQSSMFTGPVYSTSTTIKDGGVTFTTVTDEEELKKYHAILDNPFAPIATSNDLNKLSASFNGNQVTTATGVYQTAQSTSSRFTNDNYVISLFYLIN